MRYKAIFLDVDGTLVRNYSDDLPSEKVTNAITHARGKGLHVGIVTGRPLKYLQGILDHLQLEGPSVVMNGSQVVDAISRKVLWQRILLKEDIEACLPIIKKFAKRVSINDGGEDIPVTGKQVWKEPLGIYIDSLPGKEGDGLVASLTHIPTISVEKFIGYKDGQLDIWVSHVNATKQFGIAKAMEILDISSDEIIGIGDGYNDFSLMMASGLKVAMGNAIEALKDIADYVAPRVDEDGVAEVIEKFVLSQSQ